VPTASNGVRARETTAGAPGKLVLAAYDRMTEADAAGAEYESRIFPPPGHGPRRQLS